MLFHDLFDRYYYLFSIVKLNRKLKIKKLAEVGHNFTKILNGFSFSLKLFSETPDSVFVIARGVIFKLAKWTTIISLSGANFTKHIYTCTNGPHDCILNSDHYLPNCRLSEAGEYSLTS